MDQTLSMDMVERIGHRAQHPGPLEAFIACRGIPAIESGTLDKFHRYECLMIMLVEIVDADDVGMGQAAGSPAFVFHERHRAFGRRQPGLQQFKGDANVQFGVAGQPDFTHTAPAQAGKQLKTSGQNLVRVKRWMV